MFGEAGARALNAARPSSDVDLSDPEIAQAWARVTARSADFLAMGYAEGSRKKLRLTASGAGGFAGLRPHLVDDAIVYSAFAITVGGAKRLVFLCSVGENTGGMVKGRASMHKADVENALDGTSAGITVTEADELAPERVQAALTQAVGAPVALV